MLKIIQIMSFAAVLSASLIWTLAGANTAAAADFPCSSQKIYGIDGNPGYEVFSNLGKQPPQCEAARDSFAAAAVIVTGKSERKTYEWAKIIAADPNYAAKFQEGLKFGDAVNWLKNRIATNGTDRLFVIENAFQEVYGRPSTPLEQATWDPQVQARKAWYAPIVLAEACKLNASSENRLIVINSAFQKAFGRLPNEEEIKHWKAGKEHFRLIMDAHRNRLYSSDGAQERLDMLTRYYASANQGKTPTDDWMKKALVKIADGKFLYFQLADLAGGSKNTDKLQKLN